MKKISVLFFLFFAVSIHAENLPKDCYGTYAGEMASYRVVKNDIEMNIEKHDVKIEIEENKLTYITGVLVLTGTYTFLKQASNQYLIKATMSNGKSLKFQMDLLWDKKQKTIFLAGKNGEPDLTLEKIN